MAVLGPTASGKSDLALRLAEHLDGVILSVDSMQVYRGMDIGTAKPSADDQTRVRHEMIDLCEPEHEYSVAEFQRHARRVIADIDAPVVVAGGSGLHFRAVVDPLEFPPTDPDLRARLEDVELVELVAELVAADTDCGEHLDLANRRRVVRAVEVLRLTGATPTALAQRPERRDVAAYRSRYPLQAVGVDPGDQVVDRIHRRLDQMRRRGLVDEVAGLRHRLGRTAAQAVGYKELIPVVDGEIDEDTGFAAARAATEALVKRQRTYFRADPRIAWLEWAPDPDQLYREALAALEQS